MQTLRRYVGGHQDVGRAITMISRDEENHLAYCHEELLRLALRVPERRNALGGPARVTGPGGRPGA